MPDEDQAPLPIAPQPLDRGHPQPPPQRERGISQDPLPAPDGPLVADVGMHEDDLAGGGGQFAMLLGIAVFVVLLLVVAVKAIALR